MHGLTLHPSRPADERADPAAEVARLESALEARRAELAALQEELRAFKAHYARTVGARLAELADIERAVREAEARMLGLDGADEPEDDDASDEATNVRTASRQTFKTSMRKLFWSVAQAFHPDRASDEGEARRRHSIMAEASRAYTEGDAESLHALLGDDALRSHCAGARDGDGEDLPARLSILREELLTIEFGLKRARQDALYRLKLKVEEEARLGRDALSAEAERVERLIVKARHRLEHLSA